MEDFFSFQSNDNDFDEYDQPETFTQELVPVRCLTCGKILADKQRRYERLLRELSDVDPNPTRIAPGKYKPRQKTERAFEILGLHRYCCRQNMFNPGVIAVPTNKIPEDARTLEIPNPLSQMTSSAVSVVQPASGAITVRPSAKPLPPQSNVAPGVEAQTFKQSALSRLKPKTNSSLPVSAGLSKGPPKSTSSKLTVSRIALKSGKK